MTNNRLPSKKIFFGDFDFSRVAMLANVETKQLSELSFKHTVSTRCLAFGQEFLTKTINFSNVRICPYCCQEQLSIPFINSLHARTYCTKHNCSLLSIHPETGQRLNWTTHYLWRDVSEWTSHLSIADGCEAEVAINKQLAVLTNNHIVVDEHIIGLAGYCDLLEFFARFHQIAFGSVITSKYEFNSSRNFYAPAYWYIAEWPERYFELLNHFESHPMASSRLTGVRKCFRDLYDDLYSSENKNSVAYKLLKSGFEQYLKNHYSNGILMSSLSVVSNAVKAESSFISKEQSAKILNCRVSRVNIYVREGLLSANASLVNGKFLFKRTDVYELKSKLSRCISLEQCASHFSISAFHTRQLLRANIIRPLLRPSTSNRDWLIELSQADGLVQSLMAGACAESNEKRHTIKRYAFAKVNFAELIKLMLSGEIKYNFTQNKKHPNSLSQFIPTFDSSDEPYSHLMTPSEAIRLLNINKNAVYDFIKLGYLESEKVCVNRTPRPVKMITKASITAFKSRFLLTNQLLLPKANYQRVSGPDIDGCCVNLYSRH